MRPDRLAGPSRRHHCRPASLFVHIVAVAGGVVEVDSMRAMVPHCVRPRARIIAILDDGGHYAAADVMRDWSRRNATSKVKRQLVPESLIVDRWGNNGFVEKLVKAGYIGQFDGTPLDEGAVSGAAARASPRGNAAVVILEGFSCTRPRAASLVIAGYHDRCSGTVRR